VAPRSALAAGLIALRAQLTPRSSAFRHAIRLAVALIVAVIVYRAMGLGRGFWVPLTVLFVLKPDYLATYARGIGRAAGTVLGVVLAATIVALGHPSDPVALGLLAALALVAYAVFSANYALFSLTLTVLVALVVVFAGGSAIGAIEDRIVDTAIGAVIALTTFALWPTREDETLRRRLGELVAAHVRWLEAITAGLADPDAYDPTSMRRERLATRVARTNAEASLQRAAGEPASRRSAVSAASGLIDGMASLDGHFLVLAELAHDDRTSGPRPAIGSWSRALDARLQALVEHTAVPGVLRETTLALIDAARTHPNDAALTVVATQATAILAVVEGLPSVSA
jgi:uncharacterized membrane protein YccC